MNKKIAAFTLATTIVLGIPFSNYSYAETSNDIEAIQDQRNHIKGNLSAAEEQVASIVIEIEDLNKSIEQVNQELIEHQELIAKTNEEITETINEIDILQEEKSELEISIDKRYEILKSRVASYQKTGGSISFLEVIFGSKNFGDFISRVSSVNKIAESDASLMDEFEKDIQKVEEFQKESVEKLDELNELKKEQEETQALIEDQKLLNEESKQTLETKQQSLLALVEELRNEDNNLSSLEAEAKARIEAATQAANQVATQVASKSKETVVERQTAVVKPVANKQPKTEVKEESVTQKTEGRTLTMKSTAYTVESAGGSGVTSTGINLKENPNAKVIAVDPKVIPLGTVVHVEGYGYAIAGDIGGAIKGNKIDVHVPTHQAALNWGVRTVKVTLAK